MRRAVFVLLCGLVLYNSAAWAEEISRFELEFKRDQIPLNGGSRLDVAGLGVRYSESSAVSLPLALRLELTLGREAVNHEGDPASLGFQPDGYTAGINLNIAARRWRGLEIGADIGYSYHAAKQQFNLQQLEIDWRQAEARAWLALHLNDTVKLYGCLVASNIDGRQTINSGTPSRLDFKNKENSGYCGGITIEVGDGGYIGIEAESRHQRGGRLYFGRRYGF
jgi:hypothetical protein